MHIYKTEKQYLCQLYNQNDLQLKKIPPNLKNIKKYKLKIILVKK